MFGKSGSKYPNRSMDEIERVANTPNYDKIGEKDIELAIGVDSVAMDTNGDFSSKAPKNAPVIMSWKNVSVTTKKSPFPIINNVSGSITGGLWCIMGASGSGKTTLLSVLSMRMDTQRMQMEGELRINGKPFNKHLLKGMSCYVMQDDLIHAPLTVYETLGYAAALRMGGSTSAERKERIEEVMKVMGVGHRRDVVVGDSRNKGISGGERKRLCVAMELLTKPKLLFLDEPTSGLDATTALSLITTLKGLADAGECTVVCTIHQPQTKIWCQIDNLLLMKKGEIVYQGRCDKAEAFFAAQGFPCPEKMNPADHVIDLVTVGVNDADTESASVAMLSVPIDLDFGLDKNDFTLRALQPWFWQFIVICHREMKAKIRRWDIIAANLVVTCIVATFIGCGAWYQLGHHQQSIAKRNPVLFFTVIHQGVISSLQGAFAFPLDRALMLRERQAGTYYVSAYFVAKSWVDMFIQAWMPIVFTGFVYPLLGLDLYVNKYFNFMFLQMLLALCATSLSNCCSCICVSIEMSTVVLACAMEITRLYSAFFIPPSLQANYPHWEFATVISYMKYGYVGLCLNEYTDLHLMCYPWQLSTDALTGEKYCATTSGNQIIKKFGYDQFELSWCMGMMVAYIVIARFLSYLALRFIKV